LTTPLSSIALVLVASFIGSFGAVFLKSGAVRTNSVRSLLVNPRLALGVGLFLLSTVFYLMGIRHGELSVLYPMVSLGYVWTLVWSRLFFKEPLTGQKFAGLGLVLVGIMLLGLGNR
jgi:undecaprenyl phosphate-alpha-L-ara4N flippase subunit ArnE